MKKMMAMILAVTMLFGACCALAEEEEPMFATVNDAVAAGGETVLQGGGEDSYLVVLIKDGKFLRAVAELDDEAKALNDAIPEAEDIEAAFDAYFDHIGGLPISYVEEFTIAPKEQAELDTYVGKTYKELEEAGFDYMSSGTEGGENRIVFGMADGVFQYAFEMDTDMAGYEAAEESGSYDDLVVKSVAFEGFSVYAVEPRFHADGTVEEQEDAFEEFNNLIGMISDAIEAARAGGELDKEKLIDELIRLNPDMEEDIRMYADLILTLGVEAVAPQE